MKWAIIGLALITVMAFVRAYDLLTVKGIHKKRFFWDYDRLMYRIDRMACYPENPDLRNRINSFYDKYAEDKHIPVDLLKTYHGRLIDAKRKKVDEHFNRIIGKTKYYEE